MITINKLTQVNGNSLNHPRYVVGWWCFGFKTYEETIQKCKELGGKKFHNKQFGGGIAFISWNKHELINQLNELIRRNQDVVEVS